MRQLQHSLAAGLQARHNLVMGISLTVGKNITADVDPGVEQVSRQGTQGLSGGVGNDQCQEDWFSHRQSPGGRIRGQ